MQTTDEVRLRFLLPPMRAISANPTKVVGTFLVLSVLSALFAPAWWDALELVKGFTVATSTIVLGASGAVGALNRLPRKPREPKRKIAKPRHVGRQPPVRIPLLVSRCLICNRPLRDPRSQYNGVGPDCLRRYGPRRQTQPNPAYALWQQRVADAEREAEQAQVEYDRSYAAAQVEHERLVREWYAAVTTPRSRERASAQRIATRTVVVDIGVLISFALSELVSQAIGHAGIT